MNILTKIIKIKDNGFLIIRRNQFKIIFEYLDFTKSTDLNSSYKSRDDYDLSASEKDNDAKLRAIDATIVAPVLFYILYYI